MPFKNNSSGRERRRYEFFFVTVIIGLIMLVGIDRYLELGRETRRIGFELLAHHFTTAVAGVRVQWLLKKSHIGTHIGTHSGSYSGAHVRENHYVDLDGFRFYINENGWPVKVVEDEEELEAQLTATDCLKLWQALLQNPPQASMEGREKNGSRRYHVRLVEQSRCRYELVLKGSAAMYFDYASANGQVIINGPAYTLEREQ